MNAPRVACVTIPDFPVEVCLHGHPQLKQHPLAVAVSDLDEAEIVAINQQAVDSGVLVGMTVAQGHTVAANLEIHIQNHEREIEQSNIIYKHLQRLSPFVEEAQPGLYYLDAAGLHLLYQNDQRFADTIIATVIATGYPVTAGIAGNKFVARVAAEISETNSFTIVPPDKEQTFLKSLPIGHLRLPEDVLSRLRDLGLRTIGQLAAFPSNEMIRRFGPQGIILAKLARGEDTAFFDPAQPTEELAQILWLTSSIHQTASLLAHIERLLEPLLTRIGQYGQGSSTARVILSLDDKTEHQLTVTVERPTLSLPIFMRQIRTMLEALTLMAPVNGIKITIPELTALPSEQLPLRTGVSTHADSNNIPDCPSITTIVRHDTVLPEQRFSFLARSASRPKSPPRHLSPAYALGAITGLRLVHPPREITVTVTDNRPVVIGRIQQSSVSGPWELSGGWWNRRFDRLYWEIRATGGQSYLIFCDRLTSRWFLQGVFD